MPYSISLDPSFTEKNVSKCKCQNRPLFVYFIPFLNTMTNIVQKLTINCKSVDGVLGIRTRDRWMVGIDESTEL